MEHDRGQVSVRDSRRCSASTVRKAYGCSMTIATALTRRFGLRYPVVAAPLGRGATPEFLAALAREGSMGFVAITHMPEAEVRHRAISVRLAEAIASA
jgi:hypothetical protein